MALTQKRSIPTVQLAVTPLWLFPSVSVDFYILEKMQVHKDSGNIAVLIEDRLQTLYQTFVPVYTDGSKDSNTGSTGFASSIPSSQASVKRRKSDHLSVYTVEMMAIATALQGIEELQIEKVILCTNSCSALMSLHLFTSHSRQDIINEIYETLYRFKNINIWKTFMWIPAHRGNKGNEKVDALAKQALKREEIMDISLSKSEAKGIIERNVMKEWQLRWDTGNTGGRLYAVQREVGTVRTAKRSTKEEIILTRLRV